jgi:hypothetical protein
MLSAAGVQGLEGWQLNGHNGGVSLDGTTIAGYGINPNGQIEGWMATIPAPGALGLDGVAMVMAGLCRRKQVRPHRDRAF